MAEPSDFQFCCGYAEMDVSPAKPDIPSGPLQSVSEKCTRFFEMAFVFIIGYGLKNRLNITEFITYMVLGKNWPG